MAEWDKVWRRLRLMTMAGGRAEIVPEAMVAQSRGVITYTGPEQGAPAVSAAEVIDCEGRLATPGFIDCHTHLIYAGDRAKEHEARRMGASYAEIARAGGGIQASVTATRAASEDELLAASLPRLDAMISCGMTTVEIKSGYGLELASERKMLRAARRLATLRPVTVQTTFLGAHSVPAEFSGRGDDYIAYVADEMLPALAAEGLVDSVDGFCETIAFSREQIGRVMTAARALGLPLRLHAEQLSNSHGAALAAAHGARSADHLEYLDDAGIAAMAEAGMVAVLLPGAYYFMRETQPPPLAALAAAGVPIALASDCNPGTSPLTSLLMTMNMGAVLFGMSVEACLAGVTVNAARALGLAEELGTLEAGKSCDMVIWDVDHPAMLVQQMGMSPLYQRIWRGA